MIIAVTLSAIVSVAAASALAGTEGYIRRTRATTDARRTLREAESILASDLRAAPVDSIRLRGDTAIDFVGLVGISVLCVTSGTTIVLPPDAAAGGLPYTSWRALPDTGDLVAVFDTAGGGAWRSAVVGAVSTRTDGAGCRTSTGLMSPADSVARRAVTQLQLRATLGTTIPVGAPVRVMRDGRYALTRAGDGSWSLSYRRCTGAACGVAQPVAGPLAAPADSGLLFANPAASRIEVSLRAPPVATGAPREAAVLRVTLRNRATAAP
jgi:hypothetical protein